MARTLRTTAGSPARAMEVFSTVELIEALMLHLETTDVLKAMQATRTMRDTVNGSSKIQKAIGLLPDWNATFHPLPWDIKDDFMRPERRFHGLVYDDYRKTFDSAFDRRYGDYERDDEQEPQDMTGAEFELYADCRTSIYRLGSRCRALSLCAPPAIRMSIYINCAKCYWVDGSWDRIPRPVGELTPSNGKYITIGDIYSPLIRVRTKHRKSCSMPTADANIFVEFRGCIHLDEDDPVLVLRRNPQYSNAQYYYYPIEGVDRDAGDLASTAEEKSAWGHSYMGGKGRDKWTQRVERAVGATWT